MVCSKCGSKIMEDQLFCSKCGHEIHLVKEFDLSDDLMISPNISSETEQELQEHSDQGGAISFLLEHGKKKPYFYGTLFVLILSLFLLLVINHNKNQNSFDYHKEKAVAFFEKNKYELCVKSAQKAISLNEAEAFPYELIGESYLALNHKDEAFRFYDMALQRDKENRSCYDKMFDILEEKNLYSTIRRYIDESPIKNELKTQYPMCFVQPPKADLEEGLYQDYIEIKLSAPEKETVYYTLDGNLPTRNSARYEKSIKLDKEGSYLLHAISVNSYGIESEAMTSHYEIEFPVPSSPVVTPGTGKYGTDTLIKVVTEENCTAYYTWNKKMPDENSSKYSLPIKMREGSHTFTVVSVNQFGKVSLPTVRSFDVRREEQKPEN